MLSNLVQQIDAEATLDQQDYQAYVSWLDDQRTRTASNIESLQTRLTVLQGTIATLIAEESTYQTEVNRLTGEIDGHQGQLNEAQQKRTSDHNIFISEQLDFNNSISATEKGIDALHAFFGDGTKKDTRPEFLKSKTEDPVTLAAIMAKVNQAAAKSPKTLALFEKISKSTLALKGPDGSSLFDSYEGSNSAVVGIVDQMKELLATFKEDRANAVTEEAELQTAFSGLMTEKSKIIGTLSTELGLQKAGLTEVTQLLSEHQNAKQTSGTTLGNENTYMSGLSQQETDMTAMHQKRTQDRNLEKEAVLEAHAKISTMVPQLIQVGYHVTSKANRTRQQPCVNCQQVASLLRQSAQALHSEVLASAAASMSSSGSPDMLSTVVDKLKLLVKRLVEEEKSENTHKAWCDKELADSSSKKNHHETLVTQLEKDVTDTKNVIADKNKAIFDNNGQVESMDKDYKELSDLQVKAGKDYGVERQDNVDAINALNEAISVLSDYFQNKPQIPALLKENDNLIHDNLLANVYIQTNAAPPMPALLAAPLSAVELDPPSPPDASGLPDLPTLPPQIDEAERIEAPTVSTTPHSPTHANSAIQSLKVTLGEFEQGLKDLDGAENKRQADFTTATNTHNAARTELVNAGTRLQTELETAKVALTTFESSKLSNSKEVTATIAYMQQLVRSCESLVAHFDDRQQLRGQEKQALENAIKILNQANAGVPLV